MQGCTYKRILRTFSANHWNPPESNISRLTRLNLKKTSIFFSNAEKLRKSTTIDTQKSLLEPFRTIWSNGLCILLSVYSLVLYTFHFSAVRL